jgi:ABC-2 type transport system ATP-binding protein
MGKTLIVTSHILPELSRICDVVAIVTQGKLRGFGTLDDIMRKINQRRIIEVQLADPSQVKHLGALLEKQLGEDAEVTVSEQEGEVRFSTAADDMSLADLLAMVISKGMAIAQFREVPMDLEDAFLSVTREHGTASAGKL